MPNLNIPNCSLHASYEIIAKNIPGNATASSPADLGILRQNGYVIDRVFNAPATDLQAVGLRSTDSNKPPLLVFAGTSSALDQLENKNPQGAGFNQFTYQEIGTDVLNNPTFTYTDRDWQDFTRALGQTDPQLAQGLVSRQTSIAAKLCFPTSAATSLMRIVNVKCWRRDRTSCLF
jgi:hypothetical protein